MASKRQVAELAAVLAAFAFVACVVISSRGGGADSVLVSKDDGFAASWDSWLHRITNQVKAAVTLSHGLSKEKKQKLDGLIQQDMKHDFTEEKKIANEFGNPTKQSARSASSVKKAVRSFIHAAPPVHIATSPQAASRAVRAAMKAVKPVANGKLAYEHRPVTNGKLAFEHRAQRSRPVAPAGKNVITPYAKPVENAVSRDDSKVEQEEMRVKNAENALMYEEGVRPRNKQAMARNALRAATSSVGMASKPVRTVASSQQSAKAGQDPDSLQAIKERADQLAAKFQRKAQGASQVMEEAEGNQKDLKQMQGLLGAVLKKADKDGAAAGEEKKEEKSWSADMKKWGLGR